MLHHRQYHGTEIVSERNGIKTYKGVRKSDGRPVLIKSCHSELKTGNNVHVLRHEFALLQHLDGQGAPLPLAVEQVGTTVFEILEDTKAVPVSTIANNTALPLDIFLSIAGLAAEALGRIHSKGIRVGTIEAAGIFHAPLTGRTLFCDLTRAVQGTSDPIQHKETRIPQFAPEIRRHGPHAHDMRTDLYGLGLVFYALTTAVTLFADFDPATSLHAHMTAIPPRPCELNRAIPEIVSDIITKLLAKDPDDRYQTAASLKYDLDACQRGLATDGHIPKFPLGQGAPRQQPFQLPSRIYGRDNELHALYAAVERLSDGGRELVLVSGVAGIGKTTLVHELRPAILSRNSLFVASKFDEYRQTVPFSALLGALLTITRELLARPAVHVQALRKRLLAALHGNGQVLVDLVPELESLLGPQPAVAPLPPHEAARRLSTALLLFFQTICRPEQPLALFFDDLQWADTASLDLLKSLLTDARLNHFLCLGAYRDNEVASNHPLAIQLDTLRDAGVSPTMLPLSPLDRDAVTGLLAGALQSDMPRAGGLARLLFESTRGNPLFIRQALANLHGTGQLAVSRDRRDWHGDLHGIAAHPLPDNVVDLLVRQFEQLPPACVAILRHAACLGGLFDLHTLSLLTRTTPANIRAALDAAMAFGLIVLPAPREPGKHSNGNAPAKSGQAAFSHDRVREVALGLWPKRERPGVHGRIARILRETLSPEEQEVRTFEIADHMNRAIAAQCSSQARIEAAHWNLKASQKARETTAFSAALNYARQGLALLPPDAWETAYDLTLALHKEYGRLAHVNFLFDEAERTFALGIEKARTLPDRSDFICMRLTQWCMTGDIQQAVTFAINELDAYGIHIETTAIEAAVADGIEQIMRFMSGKDPAGFIDMPPMTDKALMAACSIIDSIAPSAYFFDRNLLALFGILVIRLSLTHGYTVTTFPALASFGRLLLSVPEHYASSHGFGKLALALCRKHNAAPMLAPLIIVVLDIVFVFEDNDKAQSLIRECTQLAFANGDIYHSDFIKTLSFYYAFACGTELRPLLNDIHDHYLATDNAHSMIAYCLAASLFFGLEHLAQGTDSHATRDGNTADFLKKASEHTLSTTISIMYILQGFTSHLLGDHENVVRCLRQATEHSPSRGFLVDYELHFLKTLSLLGLPEAFRAKLPTAGDREIENERFLLRAWAATNPRLFLARHLLIEAEATRVAGGPMETLVDLYDRAIAAARENTILHLVAMAEEKAGRYWLSQGKPDFARCYFARAVEAYRVWGADRKADQLAAEHAGLLPHPPPPAHDSVGLINLATVDLYTVIKAARVISGEMLLPRLAAALTHLAAENAGAQSCSIVIRRDAGLMTLPGAASPPPSGESPVETPLADSPDVPASLIAHVAKTREPLILNDASSDPRFAADPYVRRVRPRSALCAPICRQDALVGVIYLENNLMRQAFTRERLEIVNLLAAQAAISLDNARLYQDLRQAEANYRELFDNAQEGIFRAVPGGPILFANAAAAGILGYASPEHITAALASGCDTLFVDAVQRETALERLRRGDMITRQEVLLYRRDGGQVWVQVNARPILDATGRLQAVEGFFTDITLRKTAEMRAWLLNNELFRLQEREWSRISRDLHDDVGQNLLAAKILVDRLTRGRSDATASRPLPDAVTPIRTAIDECIAKVRNLSLLLHPPDLQRCDLIQALRDLCERASEKTGLRVDFFVDKMADAVLDYETEVNCFRLTQEALNNIDKHAKASHVTVGMCIAPNCVSLHVEDDGRGFDVEQTLANLFRTKRQGLATMRERAELLNGHLYIDSRIGAGSSITLEFPSHGAAHDTARQDPAY